MVSINYSSREVCCKIVYYGPGLSGKTTNLQYVHSKVPQDTRGNLISLATEADRTLYFDFLPINIGAINGFAARFQLYTVPGQVYYNATRKLVLRGVDGVVFVADSQPDKMDENIESLMNLEENLKEYGYDINDLPFVIQYNKRDLPGVLSVEQLHEKLNSNRWPHFEASATIGNGVFDTLKMIIKLVLEKAKRTGSAKARPLSEPQPAPAPPPTPEPSQASPEQAPAAASQPEQPAPQQPTQQPEPATVAAQSQPQPESRPEPQPVGQQQAAPQRSEQPQYRPYPGGAESNREAPQKKISPTSFTPAGQDEPEDASLGRNVVASDEGAQDEAQAEASGTPSMAPSKRRKEQKKRGFFKRLFGIK
jgi:hypothetical protein